MKLRLVIEVKELANRAPPIHRLRSALKNLWRGYGVRVVGIEPIQNESPAKHQPKDA